MRDDDSRLFTLVQPQRSCVVSYAPGRGRLCTTEQTLVAQSEMIALMTTNLTMSADAKVESDQRWAQWIATGARRKRERQKRAEVFAIVMAFALGLWLAKVLVLG